MSKYELSFIGELQELINKYINILPKNDMAILLSASAERLKTETESSEPDLSHYGFGERVWKTKKEMTEFFPE